MKRLSITLFAAFFLLTQFAKAQETNIASLPVLNADQVSKLDISGKWSGKRNHTPGIRKAL